MCPATLWYCPFNPCPGYSACHFKWVFTVVGQKLCCFFVYLYGFCWFFGHFHNFMILFEEKKMLTLFYYRGTLTQTFFSSNNINIGTIWKILSNWVVFLNYFEQIFTHTGKHNFHQYIFWTENKSFLRPKNFKK